MKTLLVVTSFLIALFLLSFRDPPKVEVNDILKDPDFYNGQKVEVTGVAMEVDETVKGRTCFLQGKSGKSIRIIFEDEEVQMYYEYLVKGVVHTDPNTKQVYMILFSCRKQQQQEDICIKKRPSYHMFFAQRAE